MGILEKLSNSQWKHPRYLSYIIGCMCVSMFCAILFLFLQDFHIYKVTESEYVKRRTKTHKTLDSLKLTDIKIDSLLKLDQDKSSLILLFDRKIVLTQEIDSVSNVIKFGNYFKGLPEYKN